MVFVDCDRRKSLVGRSHCVTTGRVDVNHSVSIDVNLNCRQTKTFYVVQELWGPLFHHRSLDAARLVVAAPTVGLPGDLAFVGPRPRGLRESFCQIYPPYKLLKHRVPTLVANLQSGHLFGDPDFINLIFRQAPLHTGRNVVTRKSTAAVNSRAQTQRQPLHLASREDLHGRT
jgi:hypothetical protein